MQILSRLVLILILKVFVCNFLYLQVWIHVCLRKIYSKFHHSKQSSQDPMFPVKVLANLVF